MAISRPQSSRRAWKHRSTAFPPSQRQGGADRAATLAGRRPGSRGAERAGQQTHGAGRHGGAAAAGALRHRRAAGLPLGISDLESFEHLKLLKLRSAVNLSQEAVSRGVTSFLQEQGITVHNIGLDVWTRHETNAITEELITEALRLLLDRAHHPILLMSSSGSHQVGTLVGCLRRLQHWSLSAILYEYRTFAAPTPRLWCEHFIEQWDIDLISLPSDLPRWFETQQQMLASEQAEWSTGTPLPPSRALLCPALWSRPASRPRWWTNEADCSRGGVTPERGVPWKVEVLLVV